MSYAETKIRGAIESSIRHGKVTRLDDVTVDTFEFVELAAALERLADDWVDAGDVRDYWGVDEDGDGWRVHLPVRLAGGAQ